MSHVCIAIAQINAWVGNLERNAEQILKAAHSLHAQGAKLLVTPEMVLTGYPPRDLLFHSSFLESQNRVMSRLRLDLACLKGLYVVLGCIQIRQENIYNAAVVLCEGKILGSYYKQRLPNYSVFNEQRYFHQGKQPFTFTVGDTRFGICICEDIWYPETLIIDKRTQVLLVLNASPYHIGKENERKKILRRCWRILKCPIVYINLVGGQDDLVFDGGSLILDAYGNVSFSMPLFIESVSLVHLFQDGTTKDNFPVHGQDLQIEKQIWQALVLSLQDYCTKNHFKKVVLGLSGGIDSAVVLMIAIDALGKGNVRAVTMPSCYTTKAASQDASTMIERLGISSNVLQIDSIVQAFETILKPQFLNLCEDETEENIQSRIRGTLLMALSNKFGDLVLTTGNKSELATGYCTLYGDTVGGFAVIKDVPKTLVYRLGAWRNQDTEVIPEGIFLRPPSAELRPNQKDQDFLPPYEIIDKVVELYVEKKASIHNILLEGYPKKMVKQILELVQRNEYKRRQMPLGPRITSRSFGCDWCYPISGKLEEA